jgi:histidinol-phosphate aminotransferase
MGRFLNAKYQNKSGYRLGERPKNGLYIKINANESPFSPSPGVLDTVTRELAAEQNLYADPQSAELCKAIAEYYGVQPDGVFCDSGSDVILAYSLIAFGGSAGFSFPDVTYNFYKAFSDFFCIPYTEVPVKSDFSVFIDDYVKCGNNVLLANPNSPTGLALSFNEIERLVDSDRNRLVIVDEAYVDYGNKSCIPLIKKYDNLLVIQTMSKSRSLAGARIGFAVSARENIKDLALMKAAFNPDSINSISQALGCAAIKDKKYMSSCVKKIICTREKTRKALLNRGFEVLKSHTNFLFFKPPYLPAAKFYKALKEAHVLVRYYGDQQRIKDYIRMSIGTDEQMAEVLARIDDIIASVPHERPFSQKICGVTASC